MLNRHPTTDTLNLVEPLSSKAPKTMVTTRSGLTTESTLPTFDNVYSAVFYMRTLLRDDESVHDLALCLYNTVFVYKTTPENEHLCNEVVMTFREVAMTLANSSEPDHYMPVYTALVSGSVNDVKDKNRKFAHFREMVMRLVPSVDSFYED